MLSDTQNTSLRTRLKILTKPFHDSLEATPLAIVLASGEISREQYISYLKALYILHKRVEPAICAMPEWENYLLDPHLHMRLDLLIADLEALGIFTESLTPNKILNTEDSFAKAIGMLYVLEGSTMGGKLLSQRLTHIKGKENFPVNNYFNAYEHQTIKRWGEYCNFLSEYEHKNPQDSSEIILGACSMFLEIEEILLAIN
ncbi:MAG: biliverdin-producing heme oxygenase [Sulfurimonas sp.]|nr:biliverdin-producing heme oxygenase [Sulfurimonas sp.]